MTVTSQIRELSGAVTSDHPLSGEPSRVWAATVTATNPDLTIDVAPIGSRAGKVGVLVPALYSPKVGDTVLCADLNGDRRAPVMLVALTAGLPSVTGSRGGNAALASLLSALAARGWIADHTTA